MSLVAGENKKKSKHVALFQNIPMIILAPTVRPMYSSFLL